MERGKVLVLGAGKSGLQTAKRLLEEDRRRRIILFDSREDLDIRDIKKKLSVRERAEIITGSLPPQSLLGVSLCVISPGIPLDKPFVKQVKSAGIPVIGELELACRINRGHLLAVTGTNGKTTTVTLIGEILKSFFNDVHVCGNIGEPFIQEAHETTEESATILEVSSFQLETIEKFHPHIAAITNITPDHLDRHKTMKEYVRVKESISLNQTEEDFLVLNYEDPYLKKFGLTRLRPRVVFYSSAHVLKDGFYYNKGEIRLNIDGSDRLLLNVSEIQLLGVHNYENMMCAMAVCFFLGVPLDNIIDVCRKFPPVEHRIEFVRERNGVRYYNDSKGTNPDAAIKALLAMPGQTVLIAGGYDKKIPFDDWCKLFSGRVKCLVLIGQTRKIIADCAKKYGFTNVIFAEDLEEAVKASAAYADSGDQVLLSPACASWGMFKNFEERGRMFKEIVRAL